MWAEKISNLSDATVTYELKVRGINLLSTTARTRKVLLLGILENGIQFNFRPGQVLSVLEDLGQCIKKIQSIEGIVDQCKSAEAAVYLDELDFVKIRLERIEATSKFEENRKLDLIFELEEVRKIMSEYCGQGIDISTATQNEMDEVERILRELERETEENLTTSSSDLIQTEPEPQPPTKASPSSLISQPSKQQTIQESQNLPLTTTFTQNTHTSTDSLNGQSPKQAADICQNKEPRRSVQQVIALLNSERPRQFVATSQEAL